MPFGLFERACPSISYHTKSQFGRAFDGVILKGIYDSGKSIILRRVYFEMAPFIKGHFDVDFIIALPFLSYVSKKNNPII